LIQDIFNHQMPTCRIFLQLKGGSPQNAVYN
jgi:hypothetical protein